MSNDASKMRQEINEIPAAVDRLLTRGGDAVRNTATRVHDLDIRALLSVARGSSDHVCTYLKYASELQLGLPLASVGPSVGSVYKASLRAQDMLCISVSQSGQSPDIVRMTESLATTGAFTVGITNDVASPLTAVTHATLPIHAGPELSVAATKTFVTSLVAGIWLIAELKGDSDVLEALKALPAHLEAAIRCDWSEAAGALDGQSVYTLGRGPSWAMSNEAALKLKEVCQIHAESYSSAEVLHGPVSIVDNAFPVLAFAAADAAEDVLSSVADDLTDKGAQVFATTDRVEKATRLPTRRTDHWLTDPISTIVSFYSMVEQLAASKGIDPDTPRHLKKVTETV